MNNFKKYLPSKSFFAVIISIIVLIGLFFGIFFGIKGIISLFKNKKLAKDGKQVEVTVGEIIQKDSNDNGIADWEEYLWGLDPKKSGPENKDFILAKKKALEESGVLVSDETKTLTDNDMLSQEFFATIISLQQTGDLNTESMKSVAKALGKNIVAVPIPDIYTNNMLTVENDSATANTAYHEALVELITKYSNADIGSELTFITQGLSNKDPSALYAATTVADAYRAFGEELIQIPVPRSLSTAHLSAANNYEKVGQTINDLAKILSDPLIGMKAIISYKNYSDLLASDLEKISTTLQ
ncbi:MAG: hypothetical protein WC908_02350 [Candidatus Paceibacterota bacterium]